MYCSDAAICTCKLAFSNAVAMVTWHILASAPAQKRSFYDLLTALTLKVNDSHCSNLVLNHLLYITYHHAKFCSSRSKDRGLNRRQKSSHYIRIDNIDRRLAQLLPYNDKWIILQVGRKVHSITESTINVLGEKPVLSYYNHFLGGTGGQCTANSGLWVHMLIVSLTAKH